MKRRALLTLVTGMAASRLARAQSPAPNGLPLDARLQALAGSAERFASLKALVICRGGEIVAERGFRGNLVTAPMNIKSASKSIISALVGIAIKERLLAGVDQPIAQILRRDLPSRPDPRLNTITIGHLLTMRAGLQRMSGPNYGTWIASDNWVRKALAAPFEDEPGRAMLYSTASTHLLSAILTRVTGRTTLALAKQWLGQLRNFSITSWDRDPQGIYLGGNQMAMSAHSLLSFGELYRRGGTTENGERLLPQSWIEESWVVRTHSVFNGDGYGYCWFIRDLGGEPVRYAWGYGGQMLYIVPSLHLTVVMTSDETAPSVATGYRDQLNGLMTDIIAATKAV